MKKFGVGLAVAVGLVGLVLAGSVTAAPRAQAPRDARPEVVFADDLATLQASLSPDQVDALAAASASWRSMTQLSQQDLFDRMMSDLEAILTPGQFAQMLNLLSNAAIAGGGVYMPTLCMLSARISLVFSIVGVMGCPGDTAKDATAEAYVAYSYAIICGMEGATSCPGAVDAAASSYITWTQLMGTCDLADSAAATMGATYVLCGGVF